MPSERSTRCCEDKNTSSVVSFNFIVLISGAETFATHSQERIMGLLGAMIPPERMDIQSLDATSSLTTQNFLNMLFTIARYANYSSQVYANNNSHVVLQ